MPRPRLRIAADNEVEEASAPTQAEVQGQPLHLAYRPTDFDLMIGHEEVVTSLKAVLASKNVPHAYLFTGPSGVGKTTLARILAKHLDVPEIGVTTLDAASYSSVEQMRELVAGAQYRAMGGNPRKIFIVDECFVAGTKLSTTRGSVRIEEAQLGDKVFGASGLGVIEYVHKVKVPIARLVCLTYANEKLVCSKDHLIGTSHGWVPAGALQAGDLLLRALPDAEVRTSDPYVSVLRQYLSLFQSTQSLLVLSGLPRRGGCVRTVQWPVHNAADYARKVFEGWSCSFLLPRMRQQGCCSQEDGSLVGGEIFSSDCGSPTLAAGKSPSDGKNGSGCFEEDEGEQSGASARCCRKSSGDEGEERDLTRVVEKEPERERSLYQATGSPARAFGEGLGAGTSNRDRPVAETAVSVPVQLQSRLGVASAQAGHRSGRQAPSGEKREGEGREERGCADFVKLDSIALPERDDRFVSELDCETDPATGGRFVWCYDLSVSPSSTYSANGLVVHNCHRLSRQAADVLLLPIEEPPDHLFWALCTTEGAKIPPAIRTRCHVYDLKPVPRGQIYDYLLIVRDLEGLATPEDVVQVIVDRCDGSVREALQGLSLTRDCETREQAVELLDKSRVMPEAVELARFLTKGRGVEWRPLQKLIAALSEQDPEGVRLVVVNYVAKALAGTTDPKEAARLLNVLQAFATPYSANEKMAPLLLSVGQCVFGGGQ